MEIEYIDINELVPYANNSRTHSKEQVSQIAKSIEEFGFMNPVIIDANNGIIAGHGRILGSKIVGLKEIPCIRAEHLTETQKQAYIIADNKLAENAGWDNGLLKIELEELKDLNFDMDLLGFSDTEYNKIFGKQIEEMYTTKINIPQYDITGEVYDISDLINEEKTISLIEEINKSELSQKEKNFLISSAYRHNVFNYSKIAEYYAQASKEMQQLMEKSALVIIDINDAIAEGYTKLKEYIVNDRLQ